MARSDGRESKMAENESLTASSMHERCTCWIPSLFHRLFLLVGRTREEIYRLSHKVNQSTRITGWVAMNARVARSYHLSNPTRNPKDPDNEHHPSEIYPLSTTRKHRYLLPFIRPLERENRPVLILNRSHLRVNPHRFNQRYVTRR